jgi:allantoate deiminase
MDAETVLARCDELAAISEEPGMITRRFATPALYAAGERVLAWMRAAGMLASRDSVGNLRGRYSGRTPHAPTILLGSHLDSVRDAGRYDGPLGVLVALACIERLHAAGQRLPIAIELLAFADEEGLRYQTAYLGSAVVAGAFDMALLERRDAAGVRMADAIRGVGGDPDAIPDDVYRHRPLLGYCEVHIEQGPVLESLNLPVGVVTAIAAQSRFELTFSGTAGHAGTVPMTLRRDALAAAAEFVLMAESRARATEGLVATVGQLRADPGASNVIPGRAVLSLDVRHQQDAALASAIDALRAEAERIAAARHVDLGWSLVQSNEAVPCSARLTGLLERAVTAQGLAAHRLPSGAGHDAVMLRRLTEPAMLFVRCAGGISHNPAEAVRADDVGVAIAVLERFLTSL